MYTRKLYTIVILIFTLVISAGCNSGQLQTTTQSARVVAPPGIAGTVAEYADLVGGNPMLIRGPGLVVGLGNAGSAEVPTHLRRYLIEQMRKHGVGSPMAGTGHVTPARMLADKDTAVVVVSGLIPPAAPVGTRFDVHVEALPRTQTLGLDGGILMSTEMHLSMITSKGIAARTKAWGVGRGAVFVNPFVDRSDRSSASRLREGRIPNGGVVVKSRPIRLELRRADYHKASLIERRINSRFGVREKVATAKTPAIINLRIPRSHRRDYVHFLQLVLHVCVWDRPGGEEEYARKLTEDILLPTARHEDIALTWEAMGRQVMQVIRKMYASTNPSAAFYAARTGLRLEDEMAIDCMIRIATQADSSFQLAAVRELGRARRFVRGLQTLKQMLSQPNKLLRIAAYEALMEHGLIGPISRQRISRQFVMDIVETDGDYTIYATVTGEPKVVLFGRNIPVNRPIFYCPDGELVTMNASPTDKNIMVYRKIRGAGIQSDPFYVAPRVEELIRTLGSRPSRGTDGRIRGLGLTYSQVVGVLHGLCQGGQVSAKFVLQRPPALRSIYSSVPAAGRPDMPDER